MTEATKTCTTCGEEKAMTAFHKYTRAKDGLNCSCRGCMSKARKDEARARAEREGRVYKPRGAMPRFNENGFRKSPVSVKVDGVWVFEHVHVWTQHHGRSPRQGHDIHHINGIKEDNRSSNLVELSQEAHKRIHAWEREIRCSPVAHKMCGKCHKVKLYSEFSMHPRSVSGCRSWCKACDAEQKKNALGRES